MRARLLSLFLVFPAGCYAAGMIGGGDPEETDRRNDPRVNAPAKGEPPRLGDPIGRVFDVESPGLQIGKYVPPPPPEEPPIDTDPLSHLPAGAEQLDRLCARGLENAVTEVFCAETPPQLGSLVDLQTALGMEFVSPNGNGDNGNPFFALTGHSSSLVTTQVNAINPRAIIFNRRRDDRPDANLVAMGYTRGEQFAELVVSAPPAGDQPQELTFYLLKYEQACNAGDSCTLGDLLTPDTETGWTGWTLYQDEDLKNSTLDCLQCHQPDGPGTPKILRMQELQNPWTHWFRDNREGGIALLEDYHAAHANEGYAGIPGTAVDDSDPARLEDFCEDNGFVNQPNEFITDNIEDEVVETNPMQPEVNMPPGTSETWEALYAEAVAGNVIPVPYHDVKVTDPEKLAGATTAYAAVMNGEMPKEALPDIRDIFLEEALPKMSMRPAPGLDGRGILIHMCGQCHNGRLDQTISRARFDVFELDTMSRAEKDLAIRRLRLPKESRYKMPPAIFRTLSEEETELAVQALLE